MSTTAVAQDPVKDLDDAMKKIAALLKDPTNANNPGQLWTAWHYLQVFSVWGMRIPSNDQTLKVALTIDDPGKYDFFSPMLDGHKKVYEACTNFYQTIFPGVIKVGHNLLNTASDISPADGDIFGVLIELLDNKELDGCLELIKDLQATAQENIEQADKVQKDLAGFSTTLFQAQGLLKISQDKIKADENLSEEAIRQANGGPEVLGSLANIQEMIEKVKEEYDNDVVVASTSVTYAWVFPVGTIAAAIVAGIYGDKAVKALNNLDRLKSQFESANSKLKTALSSNEIQKLAAQSIIQTIAANDNAIVQTTIVKNAWEGIMNSLTVVSDKVFAMTTITDEGEKLKNSALIKAYARQAGKSWSELVPPLKELTTNPYIVVDQNDKTLADLAKEVEKEVLATK